MSKLIAGVMGEDCMKFLPMCLESLKSADEIIYIDGGGVWNSCCQYAKLKGVIVLQSKYDQEDKGQNGKQRNIFLSYVKEKYPDDWVIFCDADEIVDENGIENIKKFIQTATPGLYSVHMRHLIQDLAHEDSTIERHYVFNRLFKVSEADKYPEVEHPVLKPLWKDNKAIVSKTDCTTIWHLAYVPNLWDIKRRYDCHMKKSNMHTPEFLAQWYRAHLFGKYPKKEFDPVELPKIILDEFGIEKDELYFQNRGIDMKHPLMVRQWYDKFEPLDVLDLGCGRGCYLYFWRWFCPDSYGIELSEWAVKNAFVDKIIQGDISEHSYSFTSNIKNENLKWDLITAIDVLEHLTDDQLNKTLSNMAKYGKNFIFSIPFIGDPNLTNDKTHLQFKTKEEWKKLIESHGIKVQDAPSNWLFSQQILIGFRKI